MHYFYFDASALVKRYIVEIGSPQANHLFSRLARTRMMALHIAIGEVMSVIVRRYNGGLLSAETYAQAVAEFRAEIVNAADFRLEAVSDLLIRSSLDHIAKYSLNATDSLVLSSALDVAADLRHDGDDLVMVTSDSRMLRAAQHVGLLAVNPEVDTLAHLDLLIDAALQSNDSAGH